MSKASKSGARSRARELIVQSLYQMQITDHDETELLSQFRDRPDYARVDQQYFDEALIAICRNTASIEESIDKLADRPLSQLDPVERGILMLGFYELLAEIDLAVPDSEFRQARLYLRAGDQVRARNLLEQLIDDERWGGDAKNLLAELQNTSNFDDGTQQSTIREAVVPALTVAEQFPPAIVPLQRRGTHFLVQVGLVIM